MTTLNYKVEEAPEWTALLKRSSGWFGGDDIFTIPLNGKEHIYAGRPLCFDIPNWYHD